MVLAVPAHHRRPSHRLLAIHLTLTHIVNIGKIDSANIGARLAHGGLTAVDIILLAAGIFHALNGLRMVLMDYWFTSRNRALALTVGLWVVGARLPWLWNLGSLALDRLGSGEQT